MSCGATGVTIPNPKRCDALQRAFPASRQAIPNPMSRRNARAWRGPEQGQGGEGGRRQGEDRGDRGLRLRALGRKSEDERAKGPAGNDDYWRDARDVRITQPARIRTLQLSPSRTRTHLS